MSLHSTGQEETAMTASFGTATGILSLVTKDINFKLHTNDNMELPTVQDISATLVSIYVGVNYLQGHWQFQ